MAIDNALAVVRHLPPRPGADAAMSKSKTKAHECRATQYSIGRTGEPIYADGATRIDIDDEAGGEFIVLTQSSLHQEARITIDPDEWPLVRKAIDKLVKVCR